MDADKRKAELRQKRLGFDPDYLKKPPRSNSTTQSSTSASAVTGTQGAQLQIQPATPAARVEQDNEDQRTGGNTTGEVVWGEEQASETALEEDSQEQLIVDSVERI